MNKENIAAISTPCGVGGISIIRVSGESSIKAVDQFMQKSIIDQPANTIYFNRFIFNNEVLDEVMVSIFKNPKSYTGEDIVEINTHGGIYITNKILEILISSDNIRLAQPGEFSKIAFLNGKKNLIDVEATLNVIEAKTQNEYLLGSSSVVNQTTTAINDVRTTLLDIVSSIEVKMDYPEYQDLEEVVGSDIINTISELINNLTTIINDSQTGAILKTGLKTVIIGAPNAGKSSLLNALSKTDKAIVSDIQGTTRDVVESEVNLGKITLHLLDTAGIRKTDEVVEQIGVDRSIKLIDEAQLILLVIDQQTGLTDEINQLYEKIKTKPHLVLINKCDNKEQISYQFSNEICISATNGYNLDQIQEQILSLFNLSDFNIVDKAILTNMMQIGLLIEAKASLESALNNINLGLDIDIIEIDLKQALYQLGEIIGVNVVDDLLNNLFSNYCLGK